MVRMEQPSSTVSLGGGALEEEVAKAVGAVGSLPYLRFRRVTAALVMMAVIGWLLVRDRRRGEQTGIGRHRRKLSGHSTDHE